VVQSARAFASRAPGERAVDQVGAYFLASRDTYLRHEFGAPEWRSVAILPVSVTNAALFSFGKLFILLMAAVAIFIFMLSHAQIRRTTEPLAQLREGTRRLQLGDFSKPVAVISDDEYGELAKSFNGMAQTLDRQIIQLRDLDAIDQVAMTERSPHLVVEEALHRALSSSGVPSVTIGVMSARTASEIELWSMDRSGGRTRRRTARLSEAETSELLTHERELVLRAMSGPRNYVALNRGAEEGARIDVFPMLHDERLLGLMAVGPVPDVRENDSQGDTLRRLADRLAMALSTVGLVKRLDELSAGTMVAFARAIDANSRWTAGHSERVTRCAMAIGAQLQLKSQDLETLERGALLHDIGKIAVPASILNKAGPLNDEEWSVMRSHPIVGFDILSPIPAFADALPLVRWHHERMDGTGYPDALSGDDIPFLARVLAVADVFDALVSDRPYRAGLSTSAASDLMKDEFRSHLDPRVMLAFLDGVRDGSIASSAPLASLSSTGALSEDVELTLRSA
jgi:HAMP domain-containing protein